jgi:F-type H+-transporting ATPase subunit a
LKIRAYFLLTSALLFSAPSFAETAAHAPEAAHHEAAHHEEGSHGHPEVITWVQLIAKATAPSPLSVFLTKWEKVIYAGIVILLVALFSIFVSRGIKMVPGRSQAFFEMLISTLDDLVCGVIGPHGRTYTPFIGSIFIYILASNLLGLIPLQNSTMAYLSTVAPIALCVFLYVQFIGITKNGILGYLHHLCGAPQDIFGWLVAPLMFPLHVLGEFIKPLSLSFRLYGNIMAGHILLAVFMGMGISMLKPLGIPAGVPIHFPFLFLELLVGVIQALVFSLLSTVYIAMMLPHEDHAPATGTSAGRPAHAEHQPHHH